MKLFGKDLSRKELIKIALLIFGMCAVISVPIMVSLGWFSNIQKNNTTGHPATVVTDICDILIDRPTEIYDESITDGEGNSLYPGMGAVKSRLAADGYDLTEVSTAMASDLAYELINVYPDLDGSYKLRPGSHGTLSFYIRPHTGMDGRTVSFSLNILGYRSIYDNVEDETTIVSVTNEQALNILKGHILFFTGRTGATQDEFAYSGFIGESGFSYDMSLHEKSDVVGKTDCYYVTLYWEWPITYDDIADGVGTKYPSAVGTYLSENPEYFFASNQNAVDRQRLNDGYNDGDQVICDDVSFIAVKIR